MISQENPEKEAWQSEIRVFDKFILEIIGTNMPGKEQNVQQIDGGMRKKRLKKEIIMGIRNDSNSSWTPCGL